MTLKILEMVTLVYFSKFGFLGRILIFLIFFYHFTLFAIDISLSFYTVLLKCYKNHQHLITTTISCITQLKVVHYVHFSTNYCSFMVTVIVIRLTSQG